MLATHNHYTRLQWNRGAMEPNTMKMFDEMLKRLDEFNSCSAER